MMKALNRIVFPRFSRKDIGMRSIVIALVGGHFWYTLPLGRYRVGGHFNRGGTLCRQQPGFASNAPDRGAMMAALTGDAPFAPSQTQ